MGEGVAIAAVSGFVTAIVWLVRLEGRVNGHDREHRQHQERHDEMRADVAYIRERIDRAVNGRH
jgi:hypothetical protein